MSRSRTMIGAGVLSAWLAFVPGPARCGEAPSASRPIDAASLHRKVLCGYQGWFRCPGDPAGEGWRHWSRDSGRIAPGTLTFEMWPDTSELADDERYPAPGFTRPDGTQARLFSSADPRTVRRHFDWMAQYGIDGVFVQRFLVELGRPSTDRVLGHVRASASATGRVYAVCYDLSGAPEGRIFDRLVGDWRRLVDVLKVTQDGRYLHHGGRPVVFVWGLYPDRFGPALAHRIIDAFHDDGPYRATLVGGCPWSWRSETDPEWARAYRRLDVISPWNVGNASRVDGRRQAATGSWKDDLAEARKAGMSYCRSSIPGSAGRTSRARRLPDRRSPGWAASSTGGSSPRRRAWGSTWPTSPCSTRWTRRRPSSRSATPRPPRPGSPPYEGLPTDWYLRLTGEGSKLIRGERKN